MKPFTKQEILGVFLIILFTFSATTINMQAALRRSRDADRRTDLGLMSDVLGKFHADFGYYPPSENGKIKMCKGENFDEILAEIKKKPKFDRDLFFQALKPCDWGKDPLRDVTDDSYEPYLASLPSDPKTKDGFSYVYLSNTNRFQIYAYLEGENDEVGYDNGIVKRNISCGSQICSFGKSHNVPVDRNIEEYERELLQKTGGT